ncbi:hypothetical protein Hanom_Chr17g01575661 [Helianthus anomalus]
MSLLHTISPNLLYHANHSINYISYHILHTFHLILNHISYFTHVSKPLKRSISKRVGSPTLICLPLPATITAKPVVQRGRSTTRIRSGSARPENSPVVIRPLIGIR